MLVPFEKIHTILTANGIDITGAFHVGAHNCEEQGFYKQLGLEPKDTVWIDAIEHKVAEATARGIPNVYHAVVTDKDDQDVTFNISNNGQSSSILEMGTHLYEHPGIVYTSRTQNKSITVDTFFERNGLDAAKYNFWNFDIQGAELLALKGAVKSIPLAKAIYLEVNERELYKGCGLMPEIDSLLAGYGFKRTITEMTRHGWGDALYVRA